ncbi:MAG: energy transducer TonB [Thermodesulfobacteriota bacterium]
MNQSKEINIYLFFSLFLHALFLYLYPFNLSEPASVDRKMMVILELERPRVERPKTVERKIKELSPVKPVKRKVASLTPVGNFRRTHITRTGINVKPNLIASKVKMPTNMTVPIAARVIENSRVALSMKGTDMISSRHVPPSIVGSASNIPSHQDRVTATKEQITTLRNPPAQMTTEDTEDTNLKFRDMILSKIEKAKVYPAMARRMGIEGEVLVGFTLFSDGKIDSVKVMSPTGSHRIFKKAAVDTVRKAAPYLPVPFGLMKEEGIRLKVKISYRFN